MRREFTLLHILISAAHPELENLHHSLDIWHKAKKLNKTLHKASQDKAAKEIKPWIEGVVNHFWHCCRIAEGDVQKLKSSWLGVVHHVCDEHSWAESECHHGPLVESEPKKFLTKDCQALEKLRSVVFDARFLANLDRYTTFRHTGMIENFNSMLTKYAPKRCSFDYPSFTSRIALAAIDHNMHVFRKQARTKNGKLCFKRKYTKSTRKFHAEPVKEKKEYSYVPHALCRIISSRQERHYTVIDRNARVANDPKLICPNLDLVTKPPATGHLIEEHQSRKEKNQKLAI